MPFIIIAVSVNLISSFALTQLIAQPVRLVPCPTPNPKVTVPADLPYLERLLLDQRG